MVERPVETLTIHAIWAVPTIFAVSLLAVLIFWVLPTNSESGKWRWIDAAWIGSSAITLFLLILSAAAEPFMSSYRVQEEKHVKAANDIAAAIPDFHGKYCVSPPLRTLPEVFRRKACERALIENKYYVGRAPFFRPDRVEPLELAPSLTGHGDSEAELWAVRDWEVIRSKQALWNEAAARMSELKPLVDAYEPVPMLRVIWFYLYAPLVAMRLGRSLWEIRRLRTGTT